MEQRRRYKNPPIEEALCEFRFSPGQEWDLTLPGKLHTEIKEGYPGKPRQQNVVEAAVQTTAGKPPNFVFREGLAKVQLVNDGGTRMVAIGKDVLSVHMLRPYQDTEDPKKGGWEEFEPRIKAAMEAYWRVAEPVGVLRIGMRYINKVMVPAGKVSVEDYFKCGPPQVKELPEDMNGFVSRVEYAYDDAVKLLLTHASIEAPENHVGFLLDLDVIWETPDAITKYDALEKAGDLRARERVAFEAVITDRARELFDAA